MKTQPRVYPRKPWDALKRQKQQQQQIQQQKQPMQAVKGIGFQTICRQKVLPRNRNNDHERRTCIWTSTIREMSQFYTRTSSPKEACELGELHHTYSQQDNIAIEGNEDNTPSTPFTTTRKQAK